MCARETGKKNRSDGEFSPPTRWPACICAREAGKKKPCRSTECLPPMSHHGRARASPPIIVRENSLEAGCCAGGWAWAASVSLTSSPDGAHGAPTCPCPQVESPIPETRRRREKRFPEKESRPAGEGGDGRRSFAVRAAILSTARLSASAPAWSTLAPQDAAATAHG